MKHEMMHEMQIVGYLCRSKLASVTRTKSQILFSSHLKISFDDFSSLGIQILTLF